MWFCVEPARGLKRQLRVRAAEHKRRNCVSSHWRGSAVTGDGKASKLLDKHHAMFEREPEQTSGGVLLVFETMSIEQWELSLKAHNARKAYLDRTEWGEALDD